MRDPRLTLASAGNPPLVAVAHGSKDPRAAATVSDLLAVVAARAADATGGGVDVRAAFLDHCAPSLPQVLGALGGGRARPPRAKARAAVGGLRSDGAQRRSDEGADSGLERVEASGKTLCIVVPLLLTAAYHSKSDIPAQLAAASSTADGGALDVRRADTLGPHPLLLSALERRLREAGVALDTAADRARTSVVLAAAGSSDPAANATIADLAAGWQRDRGWRAVVPAYASAARPSPAEAVAGLNAAFNAAQGPVVVATYLLAPGYFADKIRAASAEAGASAVSAVLGAAPEVADVVLARYRAAAAALAGSGLSGVDERRCDRLRPECGYSGRAVATRRLGPVSKVLHTGKPTWNGCYGACAAPRITLRGRLMRPERAYRPREEGNAHLARRRLSPRGYMGRVGK
jgi:sirohydrochlorin ferrochelatase